MAERVVAIIHVLYYLDINIISVFKSFYNLLYKCVPPALQAVIKWSGHGLTGRTSDVRAVS